MSVIYGVPCRVCGKAVTTAVDDVVGGDDLRGHICETCYADEQAAYAALLDHLAAQPAELAHCEECNKSVEQAGGKLYMHVASGVVALLCRQCSDAAAVLASTATAAGRLKYLSREEMFLQMLKEHWRKLRARAKGARV